MTCLSAARRRRGSRHGRSVRILRNRRKCSRYRPAVLRDAGLELASVWLRRPRDWLPSIWAA